ncbi:MAG: glycosyltransferase [Myxococcota bacterium]
MTRSDGPLRIALALESSGPGGAENMVVQLGLALKALGHAPIVVTMREGWMTERAAAGGLPVWIEPQRPGLDLGWVARFARRLVRERIDVLHSHEFAMNVFGGTAAVLARVPALSTIHGKHWIADRQRRAIAYRVLARLGVPVVAVSEDLAGYLASGLGIERARIRLVHNGIPMRPMPQASEGSRAGAPGEGVSDPAARAALRGSVGLPETGLLILAVGNLYPVKDHATLLRALPELGDARVAIAGRGEEEPHLRRLAAELGIESRVHLLGLRNDVDRLLAAADVFVQPSRSEGLPLAVLEAMAAGLPVVATRVGGMGEAVVDGETGLLVEPERPDILAGALRRLLGDEALRSRLGRAGRARAEAEFSVETMARRYVALYRGR